MKVQSRLRQAGITLVESAAVLGVVAVLVGTGLPSLNNVAARHALDGAAATLRTDIQLARSAAVSMGQTVRLQTLSNATGSCYVIHTGPTSSCTCTPAGGAACVAGATPVRSVQFASGDPVRVSSGTINLAFDGTQGTVTPTGSISLANGRGDQIKLVINVMGRVRSCRAAGQISGHPSC
jgi:type IV fimbrial biogenesis protein FimT